MGASINSPKEQTGSNKADDFEDYQDDIEEPGTIPDIEGSVG